MERDQIESKREQRRYSGVGGMRVPDSERVPQFMQSWRSECKCDGVRVCVVVQLVGCEESCASETKRVATVENPARRSATSTFQHLFLFHFPITSPILDVGTWLLTSLLTLPMMPSSQDTPLAHGPRNLNHKSPQPGGAMISAHGVLQMSWNPFPPPGAKIVP